MTDGAVATAIPRVRPADNPFASHRIDSLRFRSHGASLEELAARLDELGGRAEIVGPEGSGKTTLLEELSRHLDGEIVLVVLSGSYPDPWSSITKRLPLRVGPHHTVIVDAAGRLGPAGRLMLRKRTHNAARLIVTRHLPGRLPTLYRCRTTPMLLADLVRELAPYHAQRLGPGIEELFERHRGNLRLCFRELYDRLAAGKCSTGAFPQLQAKR